MFQPVAVRLRPAAVAAFVEPVKQFVVEVVDLVPVAGKLAAREGRGLSLNSGAPERRAGGGRDGGGGWHGASSSKSPHVTMSWGGREGGDALGRRAGMAVVGQGIEPRRTPRALRKRAEAPLPVSCAFLSLCHSC